MDEKNSIRNRANNIAITLYNGNYAYQLYNYTY